MALYFPTTADYLSRTTGTFLSGASDFTYCYWAKTFSPATAFGRTIHVLGPGNYAAQYLWEGTGIIVVEKTQFYGTDDVAYGAGYTDYDTTPYVATVEDQWFHMALVYVTTTGTVTAYINGESQAVVYTGEGNLDYTTFTSEYLGNDTGGASPKVGIGYYRSWQAALTTEQILAESRSTSAVRQENLFCETPLISPTALRDLSGNGHHWTSNGSPQFAEFAHASPIIKTVSAWKLHKLDIKFRFEDKA